MGNHFHNDTHEFFYVISGLISLYTYKEFDNDSKMTELGSGKCFTIDKREYHYIEAVKKSTLLAMHSKPFDQMNPDIHTAGLQGKKIHTEDRYGNV